MKPSDNEIEMLAAGFAIQHKNGLIRFAHALLEKYASTRASTVAGEAVYTLRVRGAIQAWTPTAAAFSIPDGEHQLFLSPAEPQASAEDVRNALMAFDEAMNLCGDFPELQHHRDALLFAVQKARAAIKTQADKDGGQQHAGEVEVDRLMAAAKGMTRLYSYVWDRTDGCLVVFPENVRAFDEAFDALRMATGEAVDDAPQAEQGERDE